MKIAFKEGNIYIKEISTPQFETIKDWGLMEWSRKEHLFHAPAGRDLLNNLAGLVPLPKAIEAERCRLNAIAKAVDAERIKQNPEPVYKFPVKFSLYQHQVRAANMCLLTFGLIPLTKKEGDS